MATKRLEFDDPWGILDEFTNEELAEDDVARRLLEPPPRKPLALVSREEWGAEPARASIEPMTSQAHHVIFNYNTDLDTCFTRRTCDQRMRELQQLCYQDGDKADVWFNFAIGGDGTVYEGRGWDLRSSAHLRPPRFHGKRIDIGWLGANVGLDYMPQHVVRPAYQLIRRGIRAGKLLPKYKLWENRHKSCMKTYYYHQLYEKPRYIRPPIVNTDDDDNYYKVPEEAYV